MSDQRIQFYAVASIDYDLDIPYDEIEEITAERIRMLFVGLEDVHLEFFKTIDCQSTK